MSLNNINFIPTRSNQLHINSGSYNVRIFLKSHPYFSLEHEIEIYLGIISNGESLRGLCFLDPTGKISIEIELSPTSESSDLSINDEQVVGNMETIKTVLSIVDGMLEEDKRFCKRIDDNLASFINIELDLLCFRSDFYIAGYKSLVAKHAKDNSLISKNIYIRTSYYDTSKWMLDSAIVILPKSLRFYVVDPQDVATVKEGLLLRDGTTFTAIVNLICSLHIAIIAYLEHRSYRQRQNRLAALRRSDLILSDYAGELQYNADDRPPVELSPQLLECLKRYLNALNIDSSQLSYPERFDSTEPLKQLVQILTLSYIPNRVFLGNGNITSRMINSFIRFQGETFQLELPRFLGILQYPENVCIDPSKTLHYLQIFRPLSFNVNAWGFLACTLRGTYLELSVVITVSLLTSLITLLPPLAITYLLSDIIPYSTAKPFTEIIALLCVAGVVVFILQLLQSRYAVRLETKADINLQTAVTNRLLQLPASSILAEDSGDLQSRVSYLSQLRQIFTQTISPLLTQSLTLIFNFGLLFWYSWPVAIFSLIPLAILLISAAYVGIVKGQFYKVILENDGKIFAGLFRYLLGVIPFRTNLCTDFVRTRFLFSARPLIVFLFRATRQGNRLNVLDVTLRPLTYCFIFPLIVWCVHNNVSSAITLASYAGFSAALTTIFTSGRALIDSTLGQLVQGWAIWQRSLEFLEITPEITASQVALMNISGRIEFRDVCFSYKKYPLPILQNISFTVNEGSFIGITGESGCGKSTLMRLAYAVLAPVNGSILYDTHNTTQFNQRALRSNFGVITQDVRLLNASLRDNILCGLSRTDDQVHDVLETACLNEFVASLPMGLETMLSERSSTISMGQKQLIIVARALLRSPKILFMDEATSYLDQATESILTENIKALGITRLAVAHRLSSIQGAHKILFLGSGKILGYDNHVNLLKQLPAYQALYEANISANDLITD
jgi:ABC-type bacteriocin/lantibiotic exporter with double-glycine peptidase domain